MGSDLPLEAETELKDGSQTPTYPSYATQHGSGLSTVSTLILSRRDGSISYVVDYQPAARFIWPQAW
jgi:hypothetical protein